MGADIVILLRKTFPTPLIWLLRCLSHRLIFDFDDAIFCNSDGSFSKTRMARFSAILRVCDHVWAGNAFLAAVADRFNPSVTIIPTCIVPDKYKSSEEKPTDLIDLVWIGSSSTRKYLEQLSPILRVAAQRDSRLRLKIIADFDLHDIGIATHPVAWSTDSEAEELASSHIGIAPMDDDDWSRGKCALKVLQYMASGLPVISSDVGVNAEITEHGKTGLLAKTETAWVDHIIELANNHEMRERLGSAGRERLLAHYSVESVFPKICADLKRLS